MIHKQEKKFEKVPTVMLWFAAVLNAASRLYNLFALNLTSVYLESRLTYLVLVTFVDVCYDILESVDHASI